MIETRRWLGVAAAVALCLAPMSTAQASAGRPADVGTDALTAMHDEAFAAAQYLAYGEAASRAGRPGVAALFRRTAADESSDHFAAEAALSGFVGSDVANLQVGITGESQDLTDYDRWATEAAADRCPAAAELFTEVRRDEAGHLARYATAVEALVDPASGVTVPDPPAVEPVAVVPGPAKCAPRTTANLQSAMQGEAFAWAKYTLFAKHAAAAGRPRLAALFNGAGQMELREHFVGEANLAGLVADVPGNLRISIAAETQAMAMYGAAAQRAAQAGDAAAAALFRQIRGDERSHREAFLAALNNLTGSTG